MSRIESVSIKNFKGIRNAELEIHGKNVFVTAKNGVGKTSFLDAIFKPLTGKDLPPEPLTEGEKRGEITIELDDLIVHVSFTDKNQKFVLSVTDKNGGVKGSPRTLLNEKIGVLDFNIGKFLSDGPTDQVNFIKKLVGIDFTDLDDEYKIAYDKRATLKSKISDLEVIQRPVNTNLEYIDIVELQERISKSEKYNNNIQEAKRRQTKINEDISSNEKQISELEQKIADLRKERVELDTRKNAAYEWLLDNEEIDISEMTAKFKDAVNNNNLFEEKKKAIETKEKLVEARAELDVVINRITEIEDTKRRVISESVLPVSGLTFDENKLYLNGLPFDSKQINTAQLIIAGLQINLALMKDLRIARFDGSLLDDDSIAYVEKWAEENDLQLFVETVDRKEKELKFEIRG